MLGRIPTFWTRAETAPPSAGYFRDKKLRESCAQNS